MAEVETYRGPANIAGALSFSRPIFRVPVLPGPKLNRRTRWLAYENFCMVPSDDPSVADAMWSEPVKPHFNGEIIVARDLLEI